MAWIAFFGAWLLVIGPVYQAALELEAEEDAWDRIRELRPQIAAGDAISHWWWLMPPVRMVLHSRRSKQRRQRLIEMLTPQELTAQIHYLDKATGWMYVGLGGFLLAIRATYELDQTEGWVAWGSWALAGAMVAITIGNTVLRQHQSERIRQMATTGPND